MRQITYSSALSHPLDSAEISRLLSEARSRNATCNITGLLIFSGERFLQVIEGPDDAIANLIFSLKKDSRHHSMSIMHDRRTSFRAFPNWEMKFEDARELRDTPRDIVIGSLMRMLRNLPTPDSTPSSVRVPTPSRMQSVRKYRPYG